MKKNKCQDSKFEIKGWKPGVISKLFFICALILMFFNKTYALNLDKVKIPFLKGDYKTAIIEGEKIIAGLDHSYQADELYYILGLSYLKDGNYLRASDIFEIILNEFKQSNFKEDAKLGLGDTYFFRQDYRRAEQYYKDLISSSSMSRLRPLAYYRLSLCAVKLGNLQEAEDYLAKLNSNFPLNLETRINNDLGRVADTYYTVQVGSFFNKANATKLTQELINKGYLAYIDQMDSQGKISYRVRVGKFSQRQEALDLSNKLSKEGYPTKICP